MRFTVLVGLAVASLVACSSDETGDGAQDRGSVHVVDVAGVRGASSGGECADLAGVDRERTRALLSEPAAGWSVTVIGTANAEAVRDCFLRHYERVTIQTP